MPPPAAILAVDGGNSKTEILVVAADGRLIGHARGPTISHQAIAPGLGLPPAQRAALGMQRLADLARHAMPRRRSGPMRGAFAQLGVLCLAGADFPSDHRMLGAALHHQGIVDAQLIYNDAFAPLRAGTHRPYGISVICGAGVNAAAIAPDGRLGRYPALGAISGDWGGSSSVGMAGLKAAVRARDRRGPRTTLASLVPRHFGVARPETVSRHLYDGRIPEARIRELSPVVFEAAMAGDAVARDIVDRLANELANMAIALARRLRMTRDQYDVVLAGGVFRSQDRRFVERIRDRISAALPGATVERLKAPPVLGAALLALDHHAEASADAEERLRREVIARVPDAG